MADYKLQADGVLRRADGAFIPDNGLNRDWQAYLLWRDGGTITLPDGTTRVVPANGPPDPEFTQAELDAQAAEATAEAAEATNVADTKADALIIFLSKQTPATIDAYFAANVTNATQAIGVLKALAKVCAILARRL